MGRPLFDPIKNYLVGEIVIYVALALIVFLVNTDSRLDIYITRWKPSCEEDTCLRYPHIQFLFGFKEGSLVGSIALIKAFFIMLELCMSEGWATFFHFFGYAVWNTMSFVVVAEVCGLRDGLQILMSIIYGFAMESLGANHDYVVYKGLVIGNSKIFYVLTSLMISLGLSVAIVSLIKETIEAGEFLLYPSLVLVLVALYAGANRTVKYYFYYVKISEEFDSVRRIKNDTKKIPRVKQYAYLVDNDPTVVVYWEFYIRLIQFFWIVALSIAHVAASNQAINYAFSSRV